MSRTARRLTFVLAVLAAPLGLATTGASAASSCAQRVADAAAKTDDGGRFDVVARSRTIQVFAPRSPGFGAYHYVCRTRTGALHRFARNSGGAADSDVLTTSILVRGSTFAYRAAVRGDRSTDRFVARSGLSGRVLRDSGAVPSTETDAPRTDQLVLLPGAVIAWATKDAGVHLTDRRGDHVLAAASGDEPTRLKATARTLSWTAGGERRSARLP